MIKRITNYDLLNLPAKIGQIYYVTDMRCLFQDTGVLPRDRLRLSALILNTDYERLNRIRPQNGKNYYVVETNFLWKFDTKWVLRDGDVRKYNSYTYTSSSGVSPVINTDSNITSSTTGDRILDNNGLLGDGSVVVRDKNRLIKGTLNVNNKKNSVDLVSYVDNGINFYPYGFYNDDMDRVNVGSLHLGIQTELSNPGLYETLERKGLATYHGDLELHGDAYTLVEKNVFSINEGLSYTPDWTKERMWHEFTCEKQVTGTNGTYQQIRKIIIFDIQTDKANIQVVTYNNSSGINVTDENGNPIYEGPLVLDSSLIYECKRVTATTNECQYIIESNGDKFTLTGSLKTPKVDFSNPDEYIDSGNEVYGITKIMNKVKITEYSGEVPVWRCDS